MAMLSFERKYRVPGGTLVGGDLFDFWVGPFYVGFFGVTTIFFSFIGTFADHLRRGPRPDVERLADQHRAARRQLRARLRADQGRRAVAAHHDVRDRRLRRPGRCARSRSAASSASASTSRSPSASRSSPTFSLEVIRPVLLGAWGFGFPYGILSHLDWVSNTGYQYLHFHYNPAHMLGDHLLLRHHPGAVAARLAGFVRDQSAARARRVKTPEHENTVFRDYIGWSIGTIGIHRLGLFLALSAPASGAPSASSSAGPVLVSKGWPEWWSWWLNLPIWR